MSLLHSQNINRVLKGWNKEQLQEAAEVVLIVPIFTTQGWSQNSWK